MQRDQSLDADVQKTEEQRPAKEAQVAEQSPDDKGEVPSVTNNDKQHFFHVANGVLAAIHPHSPELILPDGLRRGEVDAIKMLYEAKTARESRENGTGAGQIAATERLRMLQVALIKLQSAFAMARNPEFSGQARAHIEEIRIRLARLKDELQAAVLSEERKKAEEKDKKKADSLKADEESKAKKKVEASTAKK